MIAAARVCSLPERKNEDEAVSTTVVGSLPRPEWLRELILDRKEGRISEEEAAPHLDRAAAMAISLQERTGLDEVTDGEWRRESYVKVFAERVRGFRNDLNLSNIPYPAVVEPIEYYRPIAARRSPSRARAPRGGSRSRCRRRTSSAAACGTPTTRGTPIPGART